MLSVGHVEPLPPGSGPVVVAEQRDYRTSAGVSQLNLRLRPNKLMDMDLVLRPHGTYLDTAVDYCC